MSTRAARIHPTAIVEPGVAIGNGTSVWDNVHIRGPHTTIGTDCIIGEKSYVAYGVSIADRVSINAMVYICTAVTSETGVMISAGTIFTNDRFPRATTADLLALRSSEPDDKTLAMTVRAGATIGAGSIIGPGLTIGRWAMVGMGSLVTRDIPDHGLVVGQPARLVGFVCRCGEPLFRFPADEPPDHSQATCAACGETGSIRDRQWVEESAAVRPGEQ
jgi:acetyltransferase-like isoleucine patch superfamily enzyme